MPEAATPTTQHVTRHTPHGVKMRVLFLTPQWPFPPTQGAAIRNSHLIAGLAARHTVALLTFAPAGMAAGTWTAGAIPALPGAPALAALTLVPPPHRDLRARLQTLLGTSLPDLAERLASPALATAQAGMLAAAAYDWVVVEGLEMAGGLPARPASRAAAAARAAGPAPGPSRAPRWLFDAHNAEYLLQQRIALGDLPGAYRARAATGAAYSLVQWRRLRRYERGVCRAADAVTAVSAADRAALERLDPRLRVTVVPNGVDLAEWALGAAPPDPAVAALRAAGPLLVFDGSMDFRPNVDAVRWFCHACWPRIRAAHPTATFAIVGRNPAPAVRTLAALPGVLVTGTVADPRPWVAGADVYVVPMRMGGGVRLKLLQALALGRPIVSTRLGAEGVDLCPGRDLLVADAPASFAAAVLLLLADPARRATLGQAARAAVAPYAWAEIIPRFEAVLDGGWGLGVGGWGTGVRDQGSGIRDQASVVSTQHATRNTQHATRPSPSPYPPSPIPPVSLIMTVWNEAGTIRALIDSLRAQTHLPDEVVIVDAGSTDGTPACIWAAAAGAPWPLHLLSAPGANISTGRNLAIRAARHDLIAVTDAGVRLPPEWLAALLRPFADDSPRVDVASGFFAPDPRTVFERALGATVLPAVADIRPSSFLPSSRSVAFRKAAWTAARGYPEWLDYGEDLLFDLALKAGGGRFAFVPAAVALFRPRGNLRAFFQQYYRYARGDGKADLWRRRHAIRYATYLGAPLLAGLARRRPALWGILVGGAAVYCAGPYRRLRPWLAGITPAERATAIAWVPLIRVTGDCAKMIGYPVGVYWRWRHNAAVSTARNRGTASDSDAPR